MTCDRTAGGRQEREKGAEVASVSDQPCRPRSKNEKHPNDPTQARTRSPDDHSKEGDGTYRSFVRGSTCADVRSLTLWLAGVRCRWEENKEGQTATQNPAGGWIRSRCQCTVPSRASDSCSTTYTKPTTTNPTANGNDAGRWRTVHGQNGPRARRARRRHEQTPLTVPPTHICRPRALACTLEDRDPSGPVREGRVSRWGREGRNSGGLREQPDWMLCGAHLASRGTRARPRDSSVTVNRESGGGGVALGTQCSSQWKDARCLDLTSRSQQRARWWSRGPHDARKGISFAGVPARRVSRRYETQTRVHPSKTPPRGWSFWGSFGGQSGTIRCRQGPTVSAR